MPHNIEFFTDQKGTYTCSKCKCWVEGQNIEEHRTFHAEIAELIEWAQSVSKVIGGSNAPKD